MFGPHRDFSGDAPPVPPTESLGRLFGRFLKFGLLAWGGPVAQIGMLQKELVDEERWISREQFRRVLALYQVLPGPEAHEMCVYFGMLARGRVGGLLAGLGFLLPGFLLMFALSWLYLRHGLGSPTVLAAFAAVQAAVVALVVRAVARIGSHALHDRWTWGLAGLAALAQLGGLPFGVPLATGGAVYALTRAGHRRWAWVLLLVVTLGGAGWQVAQPSASPVAPPMAGNPATLTAPSLGQLAVSGLRTGLLTFGGAYTAIPFLEGDAVVHGHWMTPAQFLDGLALSGILPAPLIIFATFVGFLGGGAWGAVVITAAIFAPAFALTLIGHGPLERLVQRPGIKDALEGVTAAVVGLIAATALTLLPAVFERPLTISVCGLALVALFRWPSKFVVPVVIAAAAWIGVVFAGP